MRAPMADALGRPRRAPSDRRARIPAACWPWRTDRRPGGPARGRLHRARARRRGPALDGPAGLAGALLAPWYLVTGCRWWRALASAADRTLRLGHGGHPLDRRAPGQALAAGLRARNLPGAALGTLACTARCWGRRRRSSPPGSLVGDRRGDHRGSRRAGAHGARARRIVRRHPGASSRVPAAGMLLIEAGVQFHASLVLHAVARPRGSGLRLLDLHRPGTGRASGRPGCRCQGCRATTGRASATSGGGEIGLVAALVIGSSAARQTHGRAPRAGRRDGGRFWWRAAWLSASLAWSADLRRGLAGRAASRPGGGAGSGRRGVARHRSRARSRQGARLRDQPRPGLPRRPRLPGRCSSASAWRWSRSALRPVGPRPWCAIGTAADERR